MNRRSFFRSIFTAAALAYCPSVLRAPAVTLATAGSNIICAGAVQVGRIRQDFFDAMVRLQEFQNEPGEDTAPIVETFGDFG